MADYQKTSISTNSISFFNEDRVLMKLTYLEDAITVSINFPQVVDGKAKYPKELRHQCLVSQNNVAAFYTRVMEEVLPAFDKGVDKTVGVFTNRNKTQIFECYTKGGFFFVTIHDDLENCIPKNSYTFKFDKTQIIEDYDIGAVSYKITEIDSQFTLFLKAFEAFTNLSNGITVHEYRYRNNWFTDNVKKYLEALNMKLGLGIQSYVPHNDANSGFDSGNSYNPQDSVGSAVQVYQGSMNDIFPGADELPFR